MSPEDNGLDSPTRTLLLLVLSIEDSNRETAMDKIHIQKVIRYHEEPKNKKKIDFSNFKIDGTSYELEENLETLIEYELVDQTNNNFFLTDEGEEAAQNLKKTFSSKKYEQLAYAKKLLNDLPNDELLYFMYKTIPETQKHSTEFQRLEEKKETLVKNLFSKRKIDAYTAMKWLKLSECQFLKMFPKKKLSGNTIKQLAKGYEECSAGDLEITKDFERVENEVDDS